MKRENILLAAFSALEGAHFYSAFLPSVMTIRKFARDTEAVQSLRQGEVIATLFCIALGLIISALINDNLPAYFSTATAASMIMIYEYAIRQ